MTSPLSNGSLDPPTAGVARRFGLRPRGAPLVIGHRGASALVTENTTAAFVRAREDGADGVELDVLLSRDGEVMVFHDDDLRRLAHRPDRVRDLPRAHLQALALAGGGRIPTLDEALVACGPELLVNVELKVSGPFDRQVPALVEGVSRVIDRHGAQGRVLVSSFSPVAVGWWRRCRPDVPAGLLFEAETWTAVACALTLPLLRPAAAHPPHTLCTRPLVDAWHASGYAVNAWTVDAPDRLRMLAALGVDGLVTNDPAAARAALEVAGPAAARAARSA
jgi:glycerophosphoryl diester phosphodiesterase